MTKPSFARRFVASRIVPFSALFCLFAALPMWGAGAHLADFKAAAGTRSFTAFESGQVRPLALSPSGKLLFAG